MDKSRKQVVLEVRKTGDIYPNLLFLNEFIGDESRGETPFGLADNLWMVLLVAGCPGVVHSISRCHSLSLRISLSQSSRNLPSVSIKVRICRQACSTVVWSRPPNASPISGRLCSVSSLAMAMAT